MEGTRKAEGATVGVARRWLVVIVMPPLVLPSAAILLASLSPPPPVAVVTVPRPIQALAASDAGILVVAGGATHVLDPLGHPLRTIWLPQRDPAERSPRDDRTSRTSRTSRASWASRASPVPGPTADSGWAVSSDPDDVDRQDDPRLVDDAIGVDPPPRGLGPKLTLAPEPTRSPVVVTAGHHGWIGQADGLWKVDLVSGAVSRVLRSRGDGIRMLAAGPDGSAVACVDAGELLLSRDAGNTFQATASVSGSLRALVTTRTGFVFMLGTENLRVVRPDGGDSTALTPAGASDMASCGPEVVVLANGALYSVADPAGPSPVMKAIAAAPKGVEGITCHPAGSPWIVRGAGLWTSDDRGRTWTPRSDLPPSRILGAAVTTMGIWVATPSGLVVLSALDPPRPTPSSTEKPGPRPSTLPTSPARLAVADRSPRPRWWQAALPRIDVSLTARQATTTATQTTTRRELCGWIVATFTLDRPREAVRRWETGRQAPLARSSLPAARAGPHVGADGPTVDSITTEERQALARILEEPP